MTFRFLAAGLAVAGLAFSADVPVIVDEIVAKVNGDIVARDELDRTARDIGNELHSQGENGAKFDQDLSQHQKDILRDRIDELLLVQRAKELNINVDPEVSKYMATLQRDQVAKNPALGLGDPDKFHEFIRQQAGMTWEDFLSETKNNFMKRQVIGEEVSRKISVTDKEIEEYYEAHKAEFVREEKVYLSEILVSTDGKNAAGVAAAEKKAKDLSTRAGKGERFTDLARDNSDADSAKQGGELTGYKKGELAKEFEDRVWSLPKGGIAGPFKIGNGFEILKVDDHTKPGQAALADVRSEIQEVLYGPKMQPKVRDYLTGLRKTAFLQIKPGYLDTGAAPGQDTKWQDPAQLKPETITKAEVLEKTRHKRLFGLIPVPGTETTVTGKSSSR